MIPRPIRALAALFSLPLGLFALVCQSRAESAHTRADDAIDAEACAKLDAWRRGLDLSEARLTVDRLRAERDSARFSSKCLDVYLSEARAQRDRMHETVARLRFELTASRATADACYEIGWTAIVERDSARRLMSILEGCSVRSDIHAAMVIRRDAAIARAEAAEKDAALARGAEQAADGREAARERGHAMHVEQVEAKLAAALARIAELDRTSGEFKWCAQCPAKFYADHSPECPHYSAPVEPAVVDAVACTFCERDWNISVQSDLNCSKSDRIRACWTCFSESGDEDGLRGRYAARTQTVADAVEPRASCDAVGNCPACNPGPQPDEDKDDEERASVLDSFLTDLGNMLESHLPDAAPPKTNATTRPCGSCWRGGRRRGHRSGRRS